jgi:hypothetical protein
VPLRHMSGGVQSLSSRQQPATGVPVHVPPWQMSASVHTLSSVQPVPFVAAGSHVSPGAPLSQVRLPVLAQSPVPHVVAVGTKPSSATPLQSSSRPSQFVSLPVSPKAKIIR